MLNPHFSPAIYCNAKSAHACCVRLLHPLLRFNVLSSTPPVASIAFLEEKRKGEGKNIKVFIN
jgi:hypothetical protein